MEPIVVTISLSGDPQDPLFAAWMQQLSSLVEVAVGAGHLQMVAPPPRRMLTLQGLLEAIRQSPHFSSAYFPKDARRIWALIVGAYSFKTGGNVPAVRTEDLELPLDALATLTVEDFAYTPSYHTTRHKVVRLLQELARPT
jgi:hypothetical protein